MTRPKGGQFALHAKALHGNPFDGHTLGPIKAEHRIDRNYLKGRDGVRSNAVLAAAGYNFGLLLRWLAQLSRALIRMLVETTQTPQIA